MLSIHRLCRQRFELNTDSLGEQATLKASNDQVKVIFPISSSIHIITLNENCGIWCFQYSLDDYLDELDGALKQVKEAYEEVFP